MGLDLTQKRQAKESVSPTPAPGLMEGILSNFPVVFFRLDSAGVFIESIGLGLKRLGLRDGEAIGLSAFDLYPNLTAELKEALAGGSVQFEAHGATDGSHWWFDTYISHDPEHGGARGFAFDITSKKQSGNALHRQEKRSSELLETIPHGIVEIDLNGLITFCNSSFKKLVKPGPGALLGRALSDFESPTGDCKSLSAYLTSVAKYSAYCAPYVTVMSSTDGEAFDVRVDWNCKRDESGEVIGFVSIITDITAKKRAQEALAGSMEKFSKAFHVCPDAMTISKMPNGELIEVNDGFQEIIGFTREEALGKTSAELGIWIDIDERKAFVGELKEKGQVRDVNVQFQTKFGKVRKCLISAELFELAGKTYSLALTKDVTEILENESALRETGERLELALSAGQLGIWDWNIRTNQIQVNERWANMLGYAASEINSQAYSWQELMHPGDLDRVREEWRRHELGESSSYESSYRMCRKKGDFRTILDTGKVVEFDENGEPLRAIGIHVDITERSMREREISRNSKLESVGVLAGGIAHDFNNILTAIVGELSLIRQGLAQGVDVSEDISVCESRALKATELTQQLLSFSPGGEPRRVPVQIREVISDAVELAFYGYEGAVHVSIPKSSMAVGGDEAQLIQALRAILVNASEVSPRAGKDSVTVAVSVALRVLGPGNVVGLEAGEYVVISVADDGQGIASEMLDQVFDPYFTTKKGYNGLGLAAAHAAAQKHSGAVLVESKEGEGATFSLLLPRLVETDSSHREKIAVTNEDIGVAEKSANILVMDDEESIRKVMSRSLSHLGYTVQLAVNGEEAIDIYRKRMQTDAPIDIVILDLTIGSGMGGIETIEALRKLDPKVTAFVCSGYSNDPVMADYEKYGFTRVVAKPFRAIDLHHALQETLASKSDLVVGL